MEQFALMPDFGDQRSSKNREAKAVWTDEHKDRIIVEEKQLDVIKGTIESVVGHKDAFNLLKEGKTEVSGYYRDPMTGITCRIRPDFLSFNLMALVDIKTTISCEKDSFSKSIWNYRYDFQLAMYGAGIKEITGKNVEYHAFVAVEKEPPFEVAVYLCDSEMISKGNADYRKALDALKRCLDEGSFPKYQKNLESISLPRWAIT
jgi:exodeoxyribonuclease VIII